MKMHELLSEGEKLDELNLAGIGSAIGRGLGAAGRGVAGAARATGQFFCAPTLTGCTLALGQTS